MTSKLMLKYMCELTNRQEEKNIRYRNNLYYMQ